MSEYQQLLSLIRHLHKRIRDAVITAFETNAREKMAEIVRDEEGDTIFAIGALYLGWFVFGLKKAGALESRVEN